MLLTSFSREDIISKVWGNDYYGTDRVVDDLIRRIRKKRSIFYLRFLLLHSQSFGQKITHNKEHIAPAVFSIGSEIDSSKNLIPKKEHAIDNM